MDKPREFNSPEEFLTWLKTQSKGVQLEAGLLILDLTRQGYSGKQAAHFVYDLVTAVQSVVPGSKSIH